MEGLRVPHSDSVVQVPQPLLMIMEAAAVPESAAAGALALAAALEFATAALGALAAADLALVIDLGAVASKRNNFVLGVSECIDRITTIKVECDLFASFHVHRFVQGARVEKLCVANEERS